MSSEYDSSEDELKEQSYSKNVKKNKVKMFTVEFDRNVKQLNENDVHLIFDSNEQSLYFLGKMSFKLIEGVFEYQGVEYKDFEFQNKKITIWQSTAKSLSAIISCTSKVILEVYVNECKITSFDKSTSSFNNLFYYAESQTLFGLENHFQILTEADVSNFRCLEKTWTWNQSIERILKGVHKTTICLGVKNSGKSTFNRQLLDCYRASDKSVNFIDLDPGQQAFGKPACISNYDFKSFKDANEIVLGDSLAPIDDKENENILIGSYDCGKYYDLYTLEVERFLKKHNFSYQDTIINMPGWMNGLGKDFVNLVISTLISCTDNVEVLFLGAESEWSKFGIELNNASLEILPAGYNNLSGSQNFFIQKNWNSTQLREYRVLATLHDDHEVLLRQVPFKISYGSKNYNIKLIKFVQLRDQVPKKTEELTLLKTLPGSVVGIFKSFLDDDDSEETVQTSLFKGKIEESDKFVTHAVIHSIDTTHKYMNIIVPLRNVSNLDIINDSSYNAFKVLTTTIGLPKYEFIPSRDDVVLASNGELPYTTDLPLKKHEHTWKVRKNIMRKSQK
ncbi:hypothetical protein QEN19_003887 [Hanseniaspora menglaensis]